MTREEILKNKSQGKPDYSMGDAHPTYREDAVLLAMHEYGLQERNKAIYEAAALMYGDGRHTAQPDYDRIMNLKNKK